MSVWFEEDELEEDMGVGHDHAAHAGARHRGRLAIAFAMIAVFFAVELIAGIASRSLALISDAGHMAADVVALGAALVATRIATRPDRTGRRSFGSYRVEVFAAGLTVLIMLGVAVYVVIEAIGRIGAPTELATGTMLIVGALGLAINLVSMVLLRAGSQESINVKGAYYEVVADAAGSVGVIAAGVLVMITGSGIWDTVIALAIGAFVAVRAAILGRQVLHVLGQHAPKDLDLAEIERDLRALDGVLDIHDLHVWTLTSGMNVATAHLLLSAEGQRQAVLVAAQTALQRDHGIEHATLQIETAPTKQCHEVAW
ncbi:MAG: cation diffusion facilitator family transporter [Cumulibacter sp.]